MSLRARLTVERAAYVGLALLALVLRLADLGVHPLSDGEAHQALTAWHIYRAHPVEAGGYSPLLVTFNLLSFALLGDSEFAARLGPAILGVALMLLPYALRWHLGRAGALVAAALLALSPTALYLSRTLNGDVAAAVGGLALVAGLFAWLDASHESTSIQAPPRFNIYLVTVGLILSLTSSPAVYSTLALLLIFVALVAVLGDKGYIASARYGWAEPQSWSGIGLPLVVGLLVAATAFLFNLPGLAASADLLTGWLWGFAPGSNTPGAYPALFLLTLYEPLILFSGLFGLSAGLLRRRPIDLFLAWWFFGGILVNLLRPGRSDGEVLLVLVPLSLLAGAALGMLWESLHAAGNWQKEGIIFVTGLVIAGYAYVSLMSYTQAGGQTIWLPIASLVLFAVLIVMFGIWYDWASSLRGAALAAVVVLSILMISTGARLNYQLLADSRQPLIRAPAGEGLSRLVSTLEQVSNWQAGDATLLEIIADRRLGPAVEWQLRRFERVTWVDRVDQSPLQDGPAAILTPAEVPVTSPASYAGQDFVTRAIWSPAGLNGQALIRWVLLRTAATPVVSEKAVLWVKQPQPVEVEGQEETGGVSQR